MRDNICGIGVIGCGTFCNAYLSTLGPVYKNVRPVACADLDTQAAERAAKEWNIPKICTSEEMFDDPEVDIVLILTNPGSHYSLTMQALKAGKHVYCEKPLATSLELVNEIVAFAAEKGLCVGSAPDTFLSPEIQTVRKLIDDGEVGKVINFTANYVSPGPDLWHPNAGFLYKAGGGPVLDMAPYFLTSLVSILGPIESLYCYATRGFESRDIHGQQVSVDVMTSYCGILKFAGGVIGNINMSYDQWKSNLPGLEIYGTEGVIVAPDPNTMIGPVKLLKAETFKAAVESKPIIPQKLEAIYGPETFGLFREIETVAPRCGNERGRGVSDMAAAIAEGRKPRVTPELCRHVTEAINAFNVCLETGLPYSMTTSCERPDPLFR